MIRRPPRSTRTDTLFPYTTLVRSVTESRRLLGAWTAQRGQAEARPLSERRRTSLQPVNSSPALRAQRRAADQSGAVVQLLSHPLFLRLASVAIVLGRSDERRVGKECVGTCRSRWSTSH